MQTEVSILTGLQSVESGWCFVDESISSVTDVCPGDNKVENVEDKDSAQEDSSVMAVGIDQEETRTERTTCRSS